MSPFVAVSHMVMEALRAKEHLEALVSVRNHRPYYAVAAGYGYDHAIGAENWTGLLVVDNAWLTCGASSEIMTRAVETCQQMKVRLYR